MDNSSFHTTKFNYEVCKFKEKNFASIQLRYKSNYLLREKKKDGTLQINMGSEDKSFRGRNKHNLSEGENSFYKYLISNFILFFNLLLINTCQYLLISERNNEGGISEHLTITKRIATAERSLNAKLLQLA